MKGPGGQMGKLLKQAQKMQAEMVKAQEEIAQMEVEGSAGDGAVTVRVNGGNELLSIKIDPAAFDPDDIEMLEDLIIVAVNSALAEISTRTEERMSTVAGGMPSMPGMPF